VATTTRRTQLDGLRWFAVLAVMVSHFLDPQHQFGRFGGWGVQTFFVLSGFLIGGILLSARERMQAGHVTLRNELINFYARRTLRIFPAFYALLLACFLLGNWNDGPILWVATYTVNVWEVIHCQIAGIFGHIYTLCIEEHFYLFFPLFVLLVPRNRISLLFAGMILSGFIYRLIFADWFDVCNASRLVFYQMDALAAGAVMARLIQTGALRPGNSADCIFRRWGAWIGIIYFVNFYFLKFGIGGLRSPVLEPFFFTIFACWLIYGAARGFEGTLGAVLSFRPFIYLGSISYGIYLYHNFASWFTTNALRKLGIFEPLTPVFSFPLQVAWSIAVAALSWHLLEAPCNRAKRFFEPNRHGLLSK